MASAKEGGPGWAGGASTSRSSGSEPQTWCWTAGAAFARSSASSGINHETLRYWVAAERRERADVPAASSANGGWSWPRLRRNAAELEHDDGIGHSSP